MTNEEAIKILSNRDGWGIPTGYSGGVAEAVNMAIEALKAEPKRGEKMVKIKSLYDIGYEQGLKDTLNKYDEICRIASEIRIAVGCKTARECWELARNGDIRIVKHGRWIEVSDGSGYVGEPCEACSVCGNQTDYPSNYCPNCGAKMDGGEDGTDR